eukprot:CAMPEP_0184686108 /NCGR_PEP_ID=MMETSP0312-20130426/21335_1 /TAXON_ID=31354 /ORGANISM="Compsopogon coeruleus, Strain SAG 36.94" /LENGTH=422 /DNA_ID=CAMNT_0027140871 /DNA_START=118 /DNA_END=1386 /DNA_ORIENTATION=+
MSEKSNGSGVGPLKRVSSRKIVKGVKHLGQVPFQFKFDLAVEYWERGTYDGDVVVVWERGKEVSSTRMVRASSKETRVTIGETLSKEVTLFKAEIDDTNFLDKAYKVAVRKETAKGETVGKIHLNFAGYAGVPSGSRKIAANLSDGSMLVVRISSTFLTAGRKSKGTASGGSTGGSQYAESDAGSLDDQDFEDDFEDLLDQDDVLQKEEYPVTGSLVKEEEPPGSGSGMVDVSDPETKSSAIDSEMSKRESTRTRHSASSSKVSRRQSMDLGTNKGQLAKYEDLEKDNAILKRKLTEAQRRIKELSAQNSTLMEDLAAEQHFDRQGSTRSNSGGLASKGALQAIVQENKQLKEKLDEVTEVLEREPEVEEMVRELKEIKMTIAIAQLEKDQAQLEVMHLKREVAALQRQGALKQPGRLRLFW